MLPFVFLDESKLGPFHPFGMAVALGFFAWDPVFMRRAAASGLERREARGLTIWLLGAGAFVAWAVDALFYSERPGGLSFIGFSSTGGFVGALLGTIAWRHLRVRKVGSLRLEVRRREVPMRLSTASEVIVSTWPIAFTFGRLGCALIHDHPGAVARPGSWLSHLAVAWPRDATDGLHHVAGPLHVVWGSIPRYDLGLLEFLYLASITVAFVAAYRRRLPPWSYTAAGCLLYAPVRFFLDFLRLDAAGGGDARLGTLTFAQWWCIAVLAIGCVTARWAWKGRREVAVPPASAPSTADSGSSTADGGSGKTGADVGSGKSEADVEPPKSAVEPPTADG